MAERTCETCGHSVVCHHWRDYYGCQVVAGMREWFEEHMRCGRGLPEWVERDLVDAWSAVTQQRDELQGDLATNANLLARQCDLAREAETRAMGAGAEVARLRAEREAVYKASSGVLEDVMGWIGELAWGIELPIVAVSCPIKENGTCETHAIRPDSSKPFFEAIYQKLKIHTPLGKFTKTREDEELRLRAALYQIVASAAPRRCLVEIVGEPCGGCPVCVARAALEVTP